MSNLKKRMLIILSLIMLTSTLTGCNIKFIEKAPEKETETSEDLGQIEDNPNDTEHLTLTEVEDPNEETSSEETSEEETTESEQTSSNLGENQQEVNGVIFNMETKTMYVKTNTKLYANAKLTGTASTGVSQGSKITVYGVSEDGKIAMVKLASSTMYYVAYEYLSEEVVEYSTETIEEPEETSSEVESTEPPSSQQSSEERPSSPPSSQSSQSQSNNNNNNNSSSQAPVNNGGISYPSNPASTSINFGVTFADETFTATAVASTTVNSGPGKVLNSTGYVALKTLNKGDTIKCTGIGSNGYIRVIINEGASDERIGFVLNTDLKR